MPVATPKIPGISAPINSDWTMPQKGKKEKKNAYHPSHENVDGTTLPKVEWQGMITMYIKTYILSPSFRWQSLELQQHFTQSETQQRRSYTVPNAHKRVLGSLDL